MSSENHEHRGRPRTRTVVETTIALDLSDLIRTGQIRPGAVTTGGLAWGPEGAEVARMRYVADLGETSGLVRITHPGGAPYGVAVEATPQPFGGRRWWFLCPVTGSRAAVLYMPDDARFASRQAHRLGYRSQRLSAAGRAAERARQAAATSTAPA